MSGRHAVPDRRLRRSWIVVGAATVLALIGLSVWVGVESGNRPAGEALPTSSAASPPASAASVVSSAGTSSSLIGTSGAAGATNSSDALTTASGSGTADPSSSAIRTTVPSAPPTTTTTRAPSGCGQRYPVKMAAASGMVPVLKASAAAACVDLTVVEDDTAAPAALLAAGKIDAWVPDSRERALAAGSALAATAPSTATSPLVMAAAPATAAALNTPDTSWGALLNPAVQNKLTVTAQSGADSGAALDLTGHLSQVAAGVLGDPYVGLAATAQAVLLVKPAALGKQLPNGEISIVEQRYLNSANGRPIGSVVKTTEGVPALSYPWVETPTSTTAADKTGVANLKKALFGAAGKAARAAHGFEEPGATSVSYSGVGAMKVLPQLDVDTIRTSYAIAGGADTSANALAVLDVSGSMADVVDGSTGIDGAKAAVNPLLSALPPSTQVGLWEFGNQLQAPRDYLPLVDLGPLSGNAAQIRAEMAKAKALPTGTALYNTTWDAFQFVQSHYRPGGINVVVLLTDGRNQDVYGGMDLAALTAKIKAAADPKKPVGIMFFGYGDVDSGAMKQIVSAAGSGGTWLVKNPAQITGALLAAAGQTASAN